MYSHLTAKNASGMIYMEECIHMEEQIWETEIIISKWTDSLFKKNYVLDDLISFSKTIIFLYFTIYYIRIVNIFVLFSIVSEHL